MVIKLNEYTNSLKDLACYLYELEYYKPNYNYIKIVVESKEVSEKFISKVCAEVLDLDYAPVVERKR